MSFGKAGAEHDGVKYSPQAHALNAYVPEGGTVLSDVEPFQCRAKLVW